MGSTVKNSGAAMKKVEKLLETKLHCSDITAGHCGGSDPSLMLTQVVRNIEFESGTGNTTKLSSKNLHPVNPGSVLFVQYGMLGYTVGYKVSQCQSSPTASALMRITPIGSANCKYFI
jgi:hypothetical protein